MKNNPRCVNIDWLEVFCFEPVDFPRDADFFRAAGFVVHERAYGTRVYNQMFALEDSSGFVFMEVRRAPASSGDGGVLPVNACHLRLSNRACYYDNAAGFMASFIDRYGFKFRRISRVDICLDFERFDKGDEPAKFVRRYMEGKYSKINQASISAHGDDRWEGRVWNSLSWGSRKSAVSTKFYCKSLELKQVKDKPYIRWIWFQAGLVCDPVSLTARDKAGELYEPQIWRLEFSVKSSVNNWVVIEDESTKTHKRSLRNTLDTYAGYDRLLAMFDGLQRHYFHFKTFRAGVVKYECPDKVLFVFGAGERFVKPSHVASPFSAVVWQERLRRYLNRFLLSCPSSESSQAAHLILDVLEAAGVARLSDDIYNKSLVKAIQLAVSLKSRGDTRDVVGLIQSLLEKIKEGELF